MVNVFESKCDLVLFQNDVFNVVKVMGDQNDGMKQEGVVLSLAMGAATQALKPDFQGTQATALS